MLVGEIFFFQAEDGIRDKLVTGVQTCALPISGTWLGSRLTTQVGCQHMKWRTGSAPSPSMRYRLARHLVPGFTGFSLIDLSGTRAAAYQTWFFSSMRPCLCQPEFQLAS